MSKVESIICDECQAELIKDTNYPHEFALELKVIDTNRSTSNMQFCIHQEPQFHGVKNFCDNKCLSQWVARKIN